MYAFLSVLQGCIISIMISVNGLLTTAVGVYQSTVILHVVALAVIVLVLLCRKEKITIAKAPLWLFTSGIFNVLVVFCNNYAFGKVTVSAILGLSLIGQAVISAMVDHFGWFSMPKKPFNRLKILGFLTVLLGIATLVTKIENGRLSPFEWEEIVAIVVCLITGVFVVLSRIISGSLATKTSTTISTFWNYLVGSVFVVLVTSCFGVSFVYTMQSMLTVNPLYLTGALFSMGSVLIMSFVAPKISSYFMTLLIFIGQIFSGVALDFLLAGRLEVRNILGGAIVLLGLIINIYVDKRATTKETSTIA